VSLALYTSPMAPCPILAMISYLPIRSWGAGERAVPSTAMLNDNTPI